MSNERTVLGEVKLKGYILPEKVKKSEEVNSDSGEEEEEKQPEFLDMKEMLSISSGGHFSSAIHTKNEVEFQDLSGKTWRVEGCFALKDPWWEASCTARRKRKNMVLEGYPSYKLRTDLDRKGCRGILSLFLTSCGILPVFIEQFFKWLPSDKYVSFANLPEVLSEFENDERNMAASQQIRAMVTNSVAGKQVQAASLYPLVMKYLPTLLPGHFTDFLGKGKGCEYQLPFQMTQATQPIEQEEDEEKEEEEVDFSLLGKLEEIIRTDVWKLGFSHVMLTELKHVRCEAQLKAFHDLGLLKQIPILQRNALMVYHQLKKNCYSTGSTYMDRQSLCDDVRQKTNLKDEEGIWNAIHFLNELGVVRQERKKVALRNLFSYEKGITKCLRALVEGEPWHIPVDARAVLHAAAEERRRKGRAGNGNMVDSDGKEERSAENAACGERMYAQTDEEPTPESDQDQGPVELDPDQVQAAEMICANPVTVISGKGGCGKTTVVSLVFRAAVRERDPQGEEVKQACSDYENDGGASESWGDLPRSPGLVQTDGGVRDEAGERSSIQTKEEVLLTAPTGRAASLLTKKTCFTAYTLHQVLWSFMNAKKDESGKPENWKFAPVRVLVVDEGSLVCVQLLHSILTMLTRHAQLRKFIILGDVRQLPSIMPGNTLHDLFHSLKLAKWAIEMKTNHRAESELIVHNAEKISDMGMKRIYQPLDFDATLTLSKSFTMPSADKRFILVLLPNEDSDDLHDAVKLLLGEGPGLKDHATSQFIAFKRSDCAMVNDLCCKHYSNHLTKDHKGTSVFQPGDKVCCTKNGWVNDEDSSARVNREATERRTRNPTADGEDGDGEETRGEKNKFRLCNGEIFFIEQDVTREEDGGRRRKKNRYLTLKDGDGQVRTVSYRELQRECRLQHAWARTIHTYQGSETETLVYVLGNGSGQNWRHIYTAVTRGQKRVYVVARREGLASAIKRYSVVRNTRLEGLVKKLVTEKEGEGQNPPSQPNSIRPQPGTPNRRAPGFWPAPSTPLSSQKPMSSRASFAQSTPVIPRSLFQEGAAAVKEDDAADVSLKDDITFSKGYTWSPMNSEELFVEPRNNDITSEVSCAVNDGQPGNAQPRDSSPSKRSFSETNDCTPNKQVKMEQFESPLGSSILEQLTLYTPKGKRLFQDPPPE